MLPSGQKHYDIKAQLSIQAGFSSKIFILVKNVNVFKGLGTIQNTFAIKIVQRWIKADWMMGGGGGGGKEKAIAPNVWVDCAAQELKTSPY